MDHEPQVPTRNIPRPKAPAPTGQSSPPADPASVYEAAKRLQERIRLALLASRRDR